METKRIVGNQEGSPDGVLPEGRAPSKWSPLGSFIFGIARIAGKAARLWRKSLGAMGTAGGKPLRSLDVLRSRSVRKARKPSKRESARLEREIQLLQCRIGQQLATNVIAGQPHPAEHPQVQEDLNVLLEKLNQVKKIEEPIRGPGKATSASQPSATKVKDAPAEDSKAARGKTTKPAKEGTEPCELANAFGLEDNATGASGPKKGKSDTKTGTRPKAKTRRTRTKSQASKKKSTDE